MFKTVFIILLLLISFLSKAQDIHFSQFNNVPFYLNPAQTGMISEQFRFSANTKHQWQSVTIPYQTYLAAFDMSIQRKGNHLGKVGLGTDFMREKAGDAFLGTSGFGLSCSYIKALSRFNNEFLSGGISLKFHQKSFNPDNLYFDNQYNGLIYDPSLPGGESFTKYNFWFPTLSAGVAYMYKLSNRNELLMGLSAMNINKPKQSFFNDNTIRLNTRWAANITYKNNILRNGAVLPSLFFSKQGVFTEIIFGADYNFVKNFDPWFYKAYSAGMFYRFGDGIILRARLDYLNYKFGISYDVNMSKLAPASHCRGGFEFSISAVFNKAERKTNHEIPCPIF
jgi:type IX secretion system PorP/SprF family membrane protein